MECNFLYKLNKKSLEQIQKKYDADSSMGINIKERLDYIKKVDEEELDFSSNRLNGDYLLYGDKCREIMNSISIGKFPFLINSLFGYSRSSLSKEFLEYFSSISLAELEDYLELETKNKKYEDAYNTINYIKNYIYECLESNSELVVEDLFVDYDKKKEIVTENFDDIMDKVSEVKGGTKLVLSVEQNNSSSIYGKTKQDKQLIVEAFAFGMNLDDLEKGNYDNVKRLLYLPSRNKR